MDMLLDFYEDYQVIIIVVGVIIVLAVIGYFADRKNNPKEKKEKPVKASKKKVKKDDGELRKEEIQEMMKESPYANKGLNEIVNPGGEVNEFTHLEEPLIASTLEPVIEPVISGEITKEQTGNFSIDLEPTGTINLEELTDDISVVELPTEEVTTEPKLEESLLSEEVAINIEPELAFEEVNALVEENEVK